MVEGAGLYCPNSHCSTAFLYDYSSENSPTTQVVVCTECQVKRKSADLSPAFTLTLIFRLEYAPHVAQGSHYVHATVP